jgi:tetratricopeptide (TPR) repeat protein
VSCTALLFVLVLWKETPSWAQVAERFRSAPFFSASVYERGDPLSEPKLFELWSARGGRLRMRMGTQILFAHGGAVTRAFDVITRREVEPDQRATEYLRMLGIGEDFSLNTIARFFSGELIDVTPSLNADAAISEDLLVFDIQSPSTPEWLRIWALRESKLPVRVRVWNPLGYDCGEVVFSYSREQPDEFFDPEAFARALEQTPQRAVNLAYLHLRDPGGRPVTPADVYARSGRRMPALDPHWEGVRLFRRGAYEGAIEYLKRAIVQQPRRNWSRYLLGRCYFELREYEKALMAFSRLVELTPWSPYYCEKGKTLKKLGHHEEAAAEFKKALETLNSSTGYGLYVYADRKLEGRRARSQEQVVRLLGGKVRPTPVKDEKGRLTAFSSELIFKTKKDAPTSFDSFTFFWKSPRIDLFAKLEFALIKPDGTVVYSKISGDYWQSSAIRSDWSPDSLGADFSAFFSNPIRVRFRVSKGDVDFPDLHTFRFAFYRKKADGKIDWEKPFATIDAVRQTPNGQ